MYYPYSRTQQSLQDISTTIRGLADLRAAERERKSQHGLILAQLGMQKSQIEGQQKIGELQALSNIEEHKAIQAYRQSELDIQKQRAEETARHEKKMETQGQTKIDYERDMDAPDRFENIITKSMASQGRSPKEIQDTLNHPTMIPYRGTITTKRNIDTAKDVARAYWDIEKVKRETQGKLPEMRGKLYDKKLSLQKELIGLDKITVLDDKSMKEYPQMSAILMSLGAATNKPIDPKLLDKARKTTKIHLSIIEQELKPYEEQLGQEVLGRLNTENPANVNEGNTATDPNTGLKYYSDGKTWTLMNQ